jgi:hypothetical protein
METIISKKNKKNSCSTDKNIIKKSKESDNSNSQICIKMYDYMIF